MRTRTFERVLLVGMLLALLFVAWGVNAQRRRLDDVASRVAELEVRTRAYADATKVRAATPPGMDMFQAGGKAPGAARAPAPGAEGAPARRPGPAANARGRTPPVPGANVLEKLYEAADEVSELEQWDAETYDAVAQVFDDTTAAMSDLWKDVQEGRVSITQARRQAVEVRDSAQGRLQSVLGEEGFERLRTRVKEDFAEMMPPQR